MESSIRNLSKYRYECCVEALRDAELAYEMGRYKNTLNRGYYSIFYGIKAINALDEFDSSKHSGVIAYFNHNYVKTGIFNSETSKLIKFASRNREKSDYLDFYIASKEEAENQIERAKVFKGDVRKYLVLKGILEDKD